MASGGSDRMEPAYVELDHYVIDMNEKLGQGMFGVVYWGLDKPRAKLVAVKECPTGNQSNMNTAITEMKVLQSVKHENVLAYSTVVMKPQAFWLVMDYCQLGQLDHYFKEHNPLDERVKVEFMTQIHRGLTCMHGLPGKIVHRDIKPANMLVSVGTNGRPVVRVADFGLAKVTEDATGVAQAKMFAATSAKGNMAFMAPEMVAGQPYNEGVDVFGAGLLFLAMLQYKNGAAMFPEADPGCMAVAMVGLGQAMAMKLQIKIAGEVADDSDLVKKVKGHIRDMAKPDQNDRPSTKRSLEVMEKIFEGMKGSLPAPPAVPEVKMPRSIQKIMTEAKASQKSGRSSSRRSRQDSDVSFGTELGDIDMGDAIAAAVKEQKEKDKEEERRAEGGSGSGGAEGLLHGLLALHMMKRLLQDGGEKSHEEKMQPGKAHKWSDQWFLILMGDKLRLLSNKIAVVLTTDSNGWFELYLMGKMVTLYSSGRHIEVKVLNKEYRAFVETLQESHRKIKADSGMRSIYSKPYPEGRVPVGHWAIRSPAEGELHITNKLTPEQKIVLKKGFSGLIFVTNGDKKVMVTGHHNINPVYQEGVAFLQAKVHR